MNASAGTGIAGADPAVLDRSVVRILQDGGEPAGLGFMVADDIAVTCAHVITTALGLSDDTSPPVGASVVLDLPLHQLSSNPTGTAKSSAVIELWGPSQAGGADIAVVRLNGPLPGASPAWLIETGPQRLWGHAARVFGLPVGRPGGVWHTAMLRARQADGWVQVDMAGDGYRVTPGFSGSPVWDQEIGGVVGMMVAAEATGPAVSYLIPVSGMIAAWPGLADLAAPPSPFRGLSAFEETDAAVFFGRRDEADQLARIVADERWTTLVGPSGCGKSSLAQAGVIPLRRQAGDIPVVVRPAHGASPLRALAAALLPLLEPGLSAIEHLDRTTALASELAAHGLREMTTRILRGHHAKRLLVIIDQLEELLDPAVDTSRVKEIASVLSGSDTPDQVAVLATLRADFLDPALEHPDLGPAVSVRIHALEPMRTEQLREAVTRPINAVPGISYEPGLPERILKDAGTEPGILPLLGFTLDQLWQHRTAGQLTLRAYDEIGEVSGAVGIHAEQAWNQAVPAVDQSAAERLLTRLVRTPIGAATATRRTLSRRELDDGEWSLAVKLASARLLVIHSDADGEQVELAHEALITAWRKTAELVRADKAFLDWREGLSLDADRWDDAGRPDDLLPSQTALNVAGQWLPARDADLSTAERDYLARGRRYRRSRARRRQAAFTTLGVVTVLALLLGSLFAYARRQDARHQAQANSRALTQASQDNSGSDPALSIMLALAAYRIAPTQEARNQLLREYLAYAPFTRVLSGLPGKVATVHTSRDGNVVIASTDMGRATIFVHAATGAVRSEPVNADYVVYTMISPDGTRAAFVTEDGTAGWFEVNPEAAQPVGTIHALPKINGLYSYTGSEDGAAMSADGKLIAVPTGTMPDHADHLAWWDLDSGTIAGSIPAPMSNKIWFAPGNRSVLISAYDPNDTVPSTGLNAVELATGTVRTVLVKTPDQTYVISGDHTAVVVCKKKDTGATLTIVRTSDGSEAHAPQSVEDGTCGDDLLAANQTGTEVVVASDTDSKQVDLVDLVRGSVVSQIATLDSDTFAPDDTNLVTQGGRLLLVRSGDREIVYSGFPDGAATWTATQQVLVDGGAKTVDIPHDDFSEIELRSATDGRLLAQAPRLQPNWDPRDDLLERSVDGGLVADREGKNLVAIRDTATLHQTALVTAAMPSQAKGSEFAYFFDLGGHLITQSGTAVQEWDAATGTLIAHYDLSAFHPSIDIDGAANAHAAPYTAANQVAVVLTGEPLVRIVDLTTGQVTSSFTADADLVSIQFDRSGRYLAVLRQGSGIELWRRNPLKKDLGPLPSLTDNTSSLVNFSPDKTAGLFVTRFTDLDGHFLIAAHSTIAVYQIGKHTPADSYDFSYPSGIADGKQFSFLDYSATDGTLLYNDPNGLSGTVKLVPAIWQKALCQVIGGRNPTPDERANLPVSLPQQALCPA